MHTTGAPAWQEPPAQVSFCVHASPSLHGAVLLVWVQPLASQLSVVHGLLSSQFNVACPVHEPLTHLSFSVHGLPSLHTAPSLAAEYTQPTPDWHASLVHTLLSLHGVKVPTHTPFWHESLVVQVLPSEHEPLLSAVNTHPVACAHESLVQRLPSSHVGAGPPTHTPPEHASAVVHALLSVQLTPSLPALWLHPVTASHVSTVQGLPSSQLTPTPTQNLPEHASPDVHALPSSHDPVMAVWVQALLLQASAVHALPSLQSSVPVLVQALLTQTSPVVHALLSLHAALLAVKTQLACWLEQLSSVHGLLSLHRCAVPVQVPFTHRSLSVQKLLSLHEPLFIGVLLQPVVALHTSAVHGFWSAHAALLTVPTHALLLQVSLMVHATPSLQALVLAALMQPVALEQLSVVHTLLSSQLTVVPLQVWVASQASPLVHASPSLQPAPVANGV